MDTWELSTEVYLDAAPNKTYKINAELNIYTSLPNGDVTPLKIDLEPINIETTTDNTGEASFNINEIFVNEVCIYIIMFIT